MTRFNPSSSSGGGGDRDAGDGPTTVPPNDYLLAMVGFSIRTGKKSPHRNYLNCRYRIIHGDMDGAEFYSSLGIDTSNHNIASRLGVYCRCIGQDEEFDLDDKGDLMRVFLGKPFKAKISRREKGQYVNNDVERYIPSVSDEERGIMRLFEQNFRDTEASGSWGQTGGGTRDADPQGGDPFAGDSQRGDPAFEGSKGDPFSGDGRPGSSGADDDIPF